MGDAWEQIKDWWECDSHFRMMIALAVILGAIHLSFAVAEALAARRLAP